MLDTTVRPLLNPILNALARVAIALGLSANAVTALGALVGVGAAVAIAAQHYGLALALVATNRILDGVDGAVARHHGVSDWGGYFDIVSDYVFYAAVPLGFAFADPEANALPAAALLASFCLTCSSFLAYAIIAEKRGLETSAHGRKSFFYSTGLIEGTETVVMLLVMTALPDLFPVLAWSFALLCLLTAVQRTLIAREVFRQPPES
jgi:phosphatidylglycerophosphate synthase